MIFCNVCNFHVIDHCKYCRTPYDKKTLIDRNGFCHHCSDFDLTHHEYSHVCPLVFGEYHKLPFCYHEESFCFRCDTIIEIKHPKCCPSCTTSDVYENCKHSFQWCKFCCLPIQDVCDICLPESYEKCESISMGHMMKLCSYHQEVLVLMYNGKNIPRLSKIRLCECLEKID